MMRLRLSCGYGVRGPIRLSAGILTVLCILLSGCGSAEKYQKSDTETDQGPVEGEFIIQISPETQEWLRGLTEQMDAAELAATLGDTATALHDADSLLLTAEAIADTLDMKSPLQQLLLLFIAEGYGKIMLWEKDADAKAALTQRHAELAARLQRRLDSVRGW